MMSTRGRKCLRTSDGGFLRRIADGSTALLLPAALLVVGPDLALAGSGFRSMHGGGWSRPGGFNQGFAAPHFQHQPSFGGGFRPGGFSQGFAAPHFQPQPSFGGGLRPGGFNQGFAVPQFQPQPSFGGGFRPGGFNQGFAVPQFQAQPSFGGGFSPVLASPRQNFQPVFSTPARPITTPGIAMNPTRSPSGTRLRYFVLTRRQIRPTPISPCGPTRRQPCGRRPPVLGTTMLPIRRLRLSIPKFAPRQL